MADEYFRKQRIFQRHRKGYRQYPFSLGELRTPTSDVPIMEGMVPDGESIYRSLPPDSDTDGVPVDSLHMLFDPPFIYTGDLATGIKFGAM